VVHDVDHGHTPTSVLVDCASLRGWAVDPGDEAAGRAGHLRLGDLLVDVRQAQVWQPPCPAASVGVPPVTPLLEQLWPRRESAAELARACHRAMDALLHDRADPVSALAPLVGWGPGLTPAGDDSLVGMLAVLHRAAPPALAAGPLHRLEVVLPRLLHRTTIISAHYLRLALRGAFTEHLAALVDDAVPSGAPSAARIERLLRTGATSGADALTGVTVALSALARQPLDEMEHVA